MIRFQNIRKSFKSVDALKDINLDINKGDFLGLLGPNGAGKSTAMNLLIGYLKPDSGDIFINGFNILNTRGDFRSSIGFVPQTIALYEDLSALENLKIFGSFYNINENELENDINYFLNAVGLFERRKDNVKNYSGGMKRRLNLIVALLHKPGVLLCDEPTVGVDPQSRNAIFDFLEKLNNEGLTIVYTTHYMEEAERLCNRIAIIDSGSIIALGSPAKLLDLLPVSEHIFIKKNASTVSNMNAFSAFGSVVESSDRFELLLSHGAKLSGLFKSLEDYGIDTQSVTIQKPTLEELFLNLTGKRLRD